MLNDGQKILRDECGLNFLTFVLQLSENPGKNLNQEMDPTGDWTRARCVRSNDVTPRPRRWSYFNVEFRSNVPKALIKIQIIASRQAVYRLHLLYFKRKYVPEPGPQNSNFGAL